MSLDNSTEFALFVCKNLIKVNVCADVSNQVVKARSLSKGIRNLDYEGWNGTMRGWTM